MRDLTNEELYEFYLEGRWRRVKGYEEQYLVSDTGEVFSLRNAIELNPAKDGGGYLFVTLCANGKRKAKTVHQLVAQCFLPNPEGKLEVNHKNALKEDNRAENLEWATRSENMRHAHENNLMNLPKGSKNPSSKLTEENVLEILELLSQGYLQKDIAEKFGVHQVTISQIKNGQKWTHLTGIKPNKNKRVG